MRHANSEPVTVGMLNVSSQRRYMHLHLNTEELCYLLDARSLCDLYHVSFVAEWHLFSNRQCCQFNSLIMVALGSATNLFRHFIT